MPTARDLTPDEISYIAEQYGIDAAQIPKTVTEYSPEEATRYQEQQNALRKGVVRGAILPTLKAKAGAILAGGLGTGAGWAAGAALAPETGGLSLAIPIIGSIGGALLGSKGGDVAQKAVVNRLAPGTQEQLQQEAATAREVYPKASIATDVIAGTIAGGGKPNLRAPFTALRGVARGLENTGSLSKALTGASNTVENEAIRNVIVGNAVGTTVNGAVQLATTGEIDPKELAAGAVAGAFMSDPNAWGRRYNKNWKPLARPEPEVPAVAESIDPTGTSTAEVEAYRRKAEKDTQEVLKQQQAYRVARDAQIKLEESQYAKEVEEHQKATALAEEYKNVHWETKNPDGTFRYSDKLVKDEFVRRYKKPLKGVSGLQRAEAERFNAELPGEQPSVMRRRLFEDDFNKVDPNGYQWWKQKQQEQVEAMIAQQKALAAKQAEEQRVAAVKVAQEQQRQTELAAMQQQEEQARQQQIQELWSMRKEEQELAHQRAIELEQSRAEAAQAEASRVTAETEQARVEAERTRAAQETKVREEAARQKDLEITDERAFQAINEGRNYLVEGSPDPELTEALKYFKSGLIKSLDDYKAFRRGGKEWAAVINREVAALNDKTQYQEVTPEPVKKPQRPIALSEEEETRMLREAGKHGVGVGYVEGDIRMPGGGLARGVAYDPELVGRRLIGLARQHATSDTAYHELVHTMLRDLDASRETKLAKAIRDALGGEEAAATIVGKDYYNTVESAAKDTLPRFIQRYFGNVWNSFKFARGNREPGVASRHLVTRMKNRAGLQDRNYVTVKGKPVNRLQGDLYQEDRGEAPVEFYTNWELMPGRSMEMYHTTADIPGHPKGSTVSRRTLEQEGYRIPERPRVEQDGNLYQKVEEDVEVPLRIRFTETAIDRILTDNPNVTGRRVSGAFRKTLAEKQNMLGRWLNPIMTASEGMTEAQLNRVRDVFQMEVNQKTALPFMLRSQAERRFYDTVRKVLGNIADEAIEIHEPVMREGNPTERGKDPHYYPTTTEPKVADIFRQNKDKEAIKRLSDDFIEHQLAHGLSEEKARENLKDIVDTIQGSVRQDTGGNQMFYNAARRAQGIPLPKSWQRQDIRRNLEAYVRRMASDMSYYKHVETDPKVMAALGYKKDPWNNAINEPGIENIAGTTAVRAITESFKGEHSDTLGRTTHAAETVATAWLLGPLTEIHKMFSSMAQISPYTRGVAEWGQTQLEAAMNVGRVWNHILETGYVQKDAKKFSDLWNTQLTWAERLRGLTKGVRDAYTLNGLTEHFTKAYLQAAGEYLIPVKTKAAVQGDKTAIRMLQQLDPDFKPGTHYTGKDLIRMGSEFANLIHGSKDARTLPSWMLKDNEVSAFFKLASWNIAQTNNFMKHVVEPLRRDGNYMPLIMTTLGTALGGYVIKELREAAAGKKGPIPTFEEILNSSKGASGNVPAIGYNLAAMASFAGFAGILSLVAKYPFDLKFKNAPQGATFPADEVLANTGGVAKNYVKTLLNDPYAQTAEGFIELSTRAVMDTLVGNIQLMRMFSNHMANNGFHFDQAVYRKQLSDKLGELRRWKMVEDLPYEDQVAAEGNPYLNLDQKRFKMETEVSEIAPELRDSVGLIIQRWGDKPEVMMQKLRGLKTMNYETMPNPENMPMAFFRYLRFLRNSRGEEAATEHMMDYIRRNAINSVKGALVP